MARHDGAAPVHACLCRSFNVPAACLPLYVPRGVFCCFANHSIKVEPEAEPSERAQLTREHAEAATEHWLGQFNMLLKDDAAGLEDGIYAVIQVRAIGADAQRPMDRHAETQHGA